MPARWPASELQPHSLDEAVAIRREILPPGVWGSVDVAVKFRREPECWGYNNRSYLNGTGRFPDYRIDSPVCYIRVEINAQAKAHYSPWYRLLNPDVSLDGFVLQERRALEWWESDRTPMPWTTDHSWQSARPANDPMQPFS